MRLIVTILSICTVFAYGYALAGLGGYLIGKGSADYIIWGLLSGTACGAAALALWRRNISAFYEENPAPDEPPAKETLEKLEITVPNERKETLM